MNNLIIKGNKGFTFEFKSLDNGSIAFIRYQEGDRDGSPTNYIHTGLCKTLNEINRTIIFTLDSFAGNSVKLPRKVLEHFYPQCKEN